MPQRLVQALPTGGKSAGSLLSELTEVKGGADIYAEAGAIPALLATIKKDVEVKGDVKELPGSYVQCILNFAAIERGRAILLEQNAESILKEIASGTCLPFTFLPCPMIFNVVLSSKGKRKKCTFGGNHLA